MNATELEMIRQQSDAMTIIGMFMMICVFMIGGWIRDI